MGPYLKRLKAQIVRAHFFFRNPALKYSLRREFSVDKHYLLSNVCGYILKARRRIFENLRRFGEVGENPTQCRYGILRLANL